MAGMAEDAWVSGRVSLNLRRGPGTEYKILGKIAAEDHVRVLNSREGWREVRLDNGRTGWLPSGYLVASAPASVRVAGLERELDQARKELAAAIAEATRQTREAEKRATGLASENSTLRANDEEQATRIERLARTNRELQTTVRWREWLVGAGILVVGMITGALLRSGTRRRDSRLRF